MAVSECQKADRRDCIEQQNLVAIQVAVYQHATIIGPLKVGPSLESQVYPPQQF